MRIREATLEDDPAIVEELLRPSYRASEALAPEFNALDEAVVADADCSRWLEHEDRVLFVAEREDALAGHVSGLVTDAPPIYDRGAQLHIDGLYVKPAHRREGVASALLDRIEAWAETRGCTYVGVTVHVDNDAARRLYEGRYEVTFHSYRARLG